MSYQKHPLWLQPHTKCMLAAIRDLTAGMGHLIMEQVVRWVGSTAMQLQCWWLGQAESTHLDPADPAVAADFLSHARKRLLVSTAQEWQDVSACFSSMKPTCTHLRHAWR